MRLERQALTRSDVVTLPSSVWIGCPLVLFVIPRISLRCHPGDFLCFVPASHLIAGAYALLFLLQLYTSFSSFMEQGCMGGKIYLDPVNLKMLFSTLKLV